MTTTTTSDQLSSEHGEHLARTMWRTLEPYHASVYFAPEGYEAFKAAGLKGYWMGYFASRSAALGTPTANLVAAIFYNFHPRMVARSIPDAWRFSSPERVLAARSAAADAVLRRLLGERVTSTELAEAATLARDAAEACDVAGRPLFAANLTLPWPDERAPHLVLWHAATLLREYRADGHMASLLTGGVDGCEAHVTIVATGAMPREAIQPHRGWNDEEWAAAEERMRARGWLDASGALTEAGRRGRQAIEEHTDMLAERPWRELGAKRCARLRQLAWPLSDAIVRGGGIPVPNPMGIRWP